MARHVLCWALLCLGGSLRARGLDGASSGADGAPPVGENCDQHTTTTSQFDEYFDLDQIGNNRSELNVVELTLFVQVHNMQEELAILLSASNRSRQHPDYGQTYEVRLSNVYTVIYRETLRMSAHHSHTFNFFPGDQFRLRIQITRAGHITVGIPGETKQVILAVEDERTPIEVAYISFGSRMNAYPVTLYFNCVGAGARGYPRASSSSSSSASSSISLDRGGGGGGHQDELELQPRNHHHHDDDDDDEEDDGDGRAALERADDGHDADEDDEDEGRPARRRPPAANQQPSAAPPGGSCPACPRPEKCEVIVKACSDMSKEELLMQPAGADGEKQKYFFYFNVYLSRKGDKGGASKSAGGADGPALGSPSQAV